MFGLNCERFTFNLDGSSYFYEMCIEGDDCHYRVERDGILVHQEVRTPRLSEVYLPVELEVQLPDHRLRFVMGAISSFSFALEVYRDDDLLWRSSEKPFNNSTWARKFLAWADHMDSANTTPETAEEIRRKEQARRLRPAIAVDIAFGVLFFFVARDHGLTTAAITGAFATIALVIVDRFVKPDLTGGFAVFGAVMALMSAGLAVILQDDLAVKLRGSIMGLIGAGFAFADWLNEGRYLGQRFALYFYGLGAINPKKASLAICVSGLIIIGIDVPLAFLLTEEQWIWYNAFLDSLIAVPVVVAAMWFAKER